MVEYESRFARPVYNKFGEKIYLDQMTMAELLERVKKNDIVMVPCGSTESHGLAQAIGEDTIIGTYIAERVAFETGVTVAPPIYYGSHPSHHYGMPGTIPVKKEAYIDYVTSVVKWLSNAGFKKIILFNSHGQEYVLPIVKDKAIIEEGVKALILVTSWWRWAVDKLQVGTELKPGLFIETPFIHADEVEGSVLWYVAPKLVDPTKLKESDAERMVGVIPDKWIDRAGNVYNRPLAWYDVSAYMEIHHYPKGSVGYPSKASREKGEVIVETVIQRLVEFVDWLHRTYPPGVVPQVWPNPGDFKY